MPSYEICISRYQEDLSWLEKYRDVAVIYNKGPDVAGFKEVKKIPNVGLETYGYISYIVDHYNKLPDVVIFLQGEILDHYYAPAKKSEDQIKNAAIIDYEIARFVELASAKGIALMTGIPESDYDHYKWHLTDPSGKFVMCDKNITEWYEQYVGLPWFGQSPVTWAGLFAVRRDNILKHSLDKYIHLLNDPFLNHRLPEVSHFWERAFYPFFMRPNAN